MPMTSPGRVLVTGGASGLGAAVVAAVRAGGGTPIVVDRDIADVQDAAAYQADVADADVVADTVARAIADAGGLDAVVTAAGIDRPGALEDVSWAEWERVVLVNLMGTVSTVRSALPALRASRGRVVTVASTLALKGASDATAYCASKFGVLGFTQALAAELKGEVGVTQLIPGGMRTRFFDDRTEQYRPADDASLNDPAHVADAVLFALTQPAGCEVRELFIAHADEPSWP
ncbi:SDR family oxidoreductase [Brachybacterium huguangmaarense]|uniref:SDR family oxidoreductase n=1 Tax=Brachybacterium huguangmaarense TaxID=1652028 RepID=A0ABY6FZQ0_9MICO|nr:SDR family oxidoreductase [Brachybacterium huguangmaarense]UYG16076.1 SDR family oxidoreductase [Brachybacterium huguangmaarense]